MKLIKLKEPEILYEYINGNYNVKIYSDGTKIRETSDDFLAPLFPENIDIKITNKCNAGCPFCHENSTIDGQNGILDQEFIKSLRPGTELAIGGGNIFEHPDIEKFLIQLKELGIISNITVNQIHIKENLDLINRWQREKLVYGVGISYNGSASELMDLYFKTAIPQNVVVHVIAGIHDISQLTRDDMKILVLGYKFLRRGEIYFEKNYSSITKKITKLKTNLPEYLKKYHVLSFDNLALEQLEVQKLIDPAFWNTHYMGDDGTHTMYIDLVNEEFASSSTSPIRYSLKEYIKIDDIFNTILNEKTN